MRDQAPRLGRGLAALLGEPNRKATAKGDIGSLDANLLEPNPFQPRSPVVDGDLSELVASIQAQGLLQPILVRPHPQLHGRYQIVAGERRWRASMLAGLSEVPCFIRIMPDADASAAALVENLQRQDLNPIEEAQGFRRLLDDFGLTQEQLGKAIGKSRSHVANCLRLLTLPDRVLGYVRDGSLSAGHARAALACADPLRAAEQMLASAMSVRQAEALSSSDQGGRPPKLAPLAKGDINLQAVEADLASQLGLQVSISFNGHGGTISLRYQTLDQLDHVVAKLGRV